MSKLPIIGSLFKNISRNKQQTELMVLITPRLVRPLDPDEVPPLPTNYDQFLKPSDVEGTPRDLGQQLDGSAGTVDAPGQPK
jgi:pilus assembly protein CpaC